MEKINKILIFYILILAFVTVFVWSYIPQKSSGLLTVSFLDVGQGDSIFIEAPNGKQVLIDGGRNSSSVRELSKFMSFKDKEIDVVLATHPDADHIGGLPEVFDRFQVLNFVDSGVEGEDNIYRSLVGRVSLDGSRYIKGERGLVIILDRKEKVYLQVLSPDKNFTFEDTNNNSIVTKIVYGNTSFLLTGDASKAIENILVYSDGEILDSDILKAGHHGSKTSSSLLFLEAVSPEASVISASANNTYGHPHADVLTNLQKTNSLVFETAKEGNITFKTDGQKIWRE